MLFNKQFYEENKPVAFFSSISLLYILIQYAINVFILNENFYENALGVSLDSERLQSAIQLILKYEWLSYVILPLLLILKWLIIAGVIYAGLFLFNQEILFGNCYKIVMIAELSIILAALTKFICFLIHRPETIQDIQFFYPLSLVQLFTVKQLPTYMIYPLQQFNLFELAYWFLIAAGIKAYTEKSFKQSFKIVASSYGVGLGIWVLCVVFIQLQFA